MDAWHCRHAPGWGAATITLSVSAKTTGTATAIAVSAQGDLERSLLFVLRTSFVQVLQAKAFLALAAAGDLVDRPERRTAMRAGWTLAALVLIRYEGWLIAVGLVALVAIMLGRDRRLALPLAILPLAAIVVFLVVSRASTGGWLQTSGFFVPENASLNSVVVDGDSRRVRFLNDALLGFASIGLFVGAFIIFNTFTILVSQRTRELGLLRALGARGGQVTR